MANGWIKMRGALINHPKVIAISRSLQRSRQFRDWLTPDGEELAEGGNIVSKAALRCVTTALLLKVWSVAREHGKFVGSDLLLEHSELSDLDEMAGVPGFGAAMAAVDWARESEGVLLPNFIEYNVSMDAAERQREYRRRKKVEEQLASQSVTNVSQRGITKAVTRGERVSIPNGIDTAHVSFPGVEKKLLGEWLQVRKARKLVSTETAFNAVRAEIEAAGLTLQAGIKYCVVAGWGSFKKKWYLANEAEQASTRKGNGAAAWWSSDATILAKGKSMDPPMDPRPGESMQQFKGRIDVALEKRS